MKQLTLPITPPRSERLDNLVVGPNAQAVTHLQGLLNANANRTPVYLWGEPGTGKSRLLRGLAAEAQALGQAVHWRDARCPPPWPPEPDSAWVLLDDADLLSPDQQHTAFALFVEAGALGQQWVATGRLPPVDLPLRDDLRTRLGWGHVFALKPLTEADTRAALQRECQGRDIRLSDDVLDYLLTRFARDMNHLMDLLNRLDTFALAEHRHVTVPLLKKMLAEEGAA